MTNVNDEAGRSKYAQTAASAQMMFVGDRIQWIGRTSKSSGIAKVYIDGTVVSSVDRYANADNFQVVLFDRQVAFGKHTIRIEWTGTKNSNATGTSIHLDAFVVGIPAAAAPGKYEESDAAISYSGTWVAQSNVLDSGGKSTSASKAASASFAFDGSAVSLTGRKSAAGGIADIFVDGMKVASIDRYSSDNRYQQTLFQKGGMSPGSHTLTIEWTGTKNAASSGTSIHLDSLFVAGAPVPPVDSGVHDDQSAAITYSGPWQTTTSGSDNSGSSLYLTSAGSATLTFSGTGVAWVGRKTPSSGIVKVYLDGALQQSVDRYSSTYLAQDVGYLVQGLADSTHTVRLDWTGLKNAASAGTSLSLDAFVVSNLSQFTPPGLVTTTGTTFGNYVDAVSAQVSWGSGLEYEGQPVSYFVTRSVAGEPPVQIGPLDSSSYLDLGLTENVTYSYSVSARDKWGFISSASEASSYEQGAILTSDTQDINDFAQDACASPTITVTNGIELRAGLLAASAGDVLLLEPGLYRGWPKSGGDFQGFSMNGKSGTSSAPITVCGADGAIVSLSDNSSGALNSGTAFIINDSSWVTFRNITIENSFVGFDVNRSAHIAIDQSSIAGTGQAGIYFHDNSSGNQLTNSTITDTGRNDPRFGEGVYIGNSLANAGCQPNCADDASDRNIVAWNSITGTTAEAVEAKEQTSNGLIYDNELGPTGTGGDITSSSLQVKGDGYLVYGNRVQSDLTSGIRVLSGDYNDGETWGENNVLSMNAITVGDGAENGIYAFATFGNVVTCTNTISPASIPLSNNACRP